jgi:alpha-amylase
LLSRVEYIAGMGFDCVWMAPVLQQPVLDQCFVGWCSSGYHGYWVQDFYKIDHRFGSEADLLAVSRALHAHGRCLIILTDWVA